MKRNITRAAAFSLSALTSLCMLCACTQNSGPTSEPKPTAAYDISLTDVVEDVDLHTKKQSDFLEQENYNYIIDYANGTSELSRPESISLEWQATAASAASSPIEQFLLELSTDEAFQEDVWSYTTTESSYSVYNLYIDSTYYWRVTAQLQDGTSCVSSASTFTTSATAPRNLYIDGITNVRDLGGWKTPNGASVRQGLLYRCGRLNASSSSSVKIEITDAGKSEMLERLGVKTEIDLRMVSNNEVGGITSSPLGDDVTYTQCPMDYTASNLITGNISQIRDIFAILSDLNNYPMIFHCNIGTDRTGLIAFLINGLVGVSEDDLYRDYLFSNFGNIGGSRKVSSIQSSYVNYIKSFEGETISQQIYHCLSSAKVGVPTEYLDAIIEIMTAE